MNIQEANIKFTRNGDKISSISVQMPIWNKLSDHGNLIVSLPVLGLETIAKDENDAERAIEEAIISFCIISEKFGQGVEKELQSLGWVNVDVESGEPVMGYCVSNPDAVLEKILETGENYVNSRLEIA